MINVQNITSKLALMPDAALKQYAEMHKEDPYTFALALSESNRRKEMRSQAPQAAPQPKVVDQELADMDVRKALPEDLGIARLPVDMNMAGGGIVAFGDGGQTDYSNEGQNAGVSFDNALDIEGIDEPRQRAFLKAIYSQESGSGKNTKTSNKNAIGGMQIIPSTFAAVADKDMDITNPFDNMRAGIRYASQGYNKAGGDPVLAGAYYYGGPSGMKKAAKGIKVFDSSNPKAPTTIGYGKSIAKKMFEFLPMGAANAESLPAEQPPATQSAQAQPVQTQTAQAQPEQEDSYLVPAVGVGAAAAGLGYYPAKAGVQALQDKIKVADAARVVEGSKMERALAEQAARNTEKLRLGLNSTPGSGVTAATDKALAEKAAQRVAAKQAAITGSEMAGKYGAGTALRGLGAAGRLAISAPVMGLEAIGEQLGRFQQGVMAAPTGEKLREALYENPMLGAMDPDAAFGAAIMDAPKIAEKQNAALNPNARVDDRARRNPENYRVAPAAANDTPREVESLLKRHPVTGAPTASAGDIAQAAKASTPPTEDNEGWSGNDWLQFGLAMMAGQSPYAMQNIGNAGLNVLANKTARQQEKNKLDLYKSVHGGKPGQSIQIAERLMANDPSLSFEDALARGTELTGGNTKEALAQTRADAVTAQNYKTWLAAIQKIDSSMVGIIGKSNTATPAQKKAYADAITALGPNPMGNTVATPTAPAASSYKVLGVEPK